MDVALPKSIGKFRVVTKIGQGAMGAVYRAVQEPLERPVALKILPPEYTNDPEYVGRFLREARTVAALKHDNIVQVYDAGEADGKYYIAMELVEGGSIQKFVDGKDKKISEEEGLNLLLQAAKGLAAAHAKGLVHRDIKPENMLIGSDNVLRLVDFGLVMESTSTTQLTATGACLGTPMYMSPEQADGETADARADIYSLGVTFYRVFTGQPPFTSPTVMNLLFKHKFEAPPDPKTLRSDLSQNVRNLLLHLMAKRKEDRPQTAQAIVDMIEGIKRGKAVPPPPMFLPVGAGLESSMAGATGPRPSFASHTGLFAAAVVVVLLAIGAYFALHRNPSGANGAVAIQPDAPKPPQNTQSAEKPDYAAKGDQAFADGRDADAVEFYERALAITPTEEIQTKLKRAKDTIEFGRLMASAAALEAKGDLEGAAARFAEAVAYDSGTKAREEASRVRAILTQHNALDTKQKDTERDAQSKQAADDEQAGKFETAAEHYSRAASLSDNPMKQVFADKARECRRQDYLAKAVAADELKSYTEALVWYKRALDLKADALVSQQIENLEKKLKASAAEEPAGAREMREGQKALAAGDWVKARMLYTLAQTYQPGNTEIAARLKEIDGRELLAKGDTLRTAGKLADAEAAYTQTLQKYPELAVDAAARIKALGANNSAASALVTKVDGLFRAGKDTDALSEVLAASRANPTSKELKELKTSLEAIAAVTDVYTELERVNDLAFARVRDFREVDDDDRADDLRKTFEDLKKRFTGKAATARPLFLDHNYAGVQGALDTARRDAMKMADDLTNAYELCDKKADKAAEKSTGAKVLGISIGVGGDKKKAQKYRDVGEAFKKLADQAKAKSN
ncbi:MAG TPA: protein kinase [Planctomycetota bacterium]|jgi:serine/threonine-protein kinase